MDTCAVETGLLKKKPCGHPAVAKCANCEMPLCSSHGVPVLSATKQKTGKMMCSECDKAAKASDKAAAAANYGRPPPPIKKPAPGAAPAAAAPKPPQPAAAPKPAPALAAKPAAAPAPAPAKDDIDAPLEFTPSKKK
jgi:cell division septation protein DedD